MRPAALQIIAPEGERDAQDARPRAHVPAAHLTAETIAEALQAAHGVMADAARRLGISRNTLYLRCHADPVVEAARTEAREVFIDLAESELYKLVASGNPSAIIYTLRTVGHARGWREGVVVEQEAAPRRKVDMTAALKALSPAELMQLEQIVSKLESTAKAARERDAGDDADDEVSHRPSRRGRGGWGEVSEVEAVEAVAAPDEVVPDEIALNPGDVSKPE